MRLAPAEGVRATANSDRLGPVPKAAAFTDRRRPAPKIMGSVVLGSVVLALFFGGLGAWSALAPLATAAMAPGTVVVDGNRKTIQHLEGGIIKELKVKNGDAVTAGQVMVQLDDTQARANWNLLRGQQDALRAQEARLIAERDGAASVRFPADLASRRGLPAVAELLAGQESIFASRARLLDGQAELLRQQVEQFQSEIESRQAQVAATERQSRLLKEELAGIRKLVEKGLERRARLLALERQGATLEGTRGEQLGLIARAGQQIAELELTIVNQQNSHTNTVMAELQEVQNRLGDLNERLLASRDVLHRLEIIAPINGVVVGQRHFTPGGVVRPGEPILDIVPDEDRLIVEAKVQPTDIDQVRIGLPAQVTLTAFKQRTTPILTGEIAYISADSLLDDRTGRRHFTARVTIPAEEMERLRGRQLSPGMPADVLIVTGHRTAFDYLIAPFRESLQHAFHEE